MSDLYRLVYASKNLLQGPDPEVTAAVRQILATSQANNRAAGVTGALMFNGGAFAQVLEGPRAGVEDTFERIQRDERHGDVTVLQCSPIEERGFPDWSMAFVGQSARGQALWCGLAAESGFDLSRLDGDGVFAMLHGLVREEEGAPTAVSPLPAGPRPVAPADAAAPAPDAVAPPPRPAPTEVPAAESGSAALAVLRTALARERERAHALSAEVDELQVALAVSRDRLEALRAERDHWAERARMLAAVVCGDAEAVRRGATREPRETRASERSVA
ncbi:BLUF domain-containing protein [Methylobacterium nonmethylotrophicum]|uniref:BLUF domain-containing protein n=1 Tax=Methylobacterium nonmethylotrophicum TaxID=1141884 RepID=A0A4Z0NR70_9HYPH|nr:BLUF domain-containing protein [Methylobacterium nonmethylotrophicum]TGD98330.1 BLUF domain-containing protein [Methylobacterium nonmethylotrophicum]